MNAASADQVYLDEPWLYLCWDASHSVVRSEWKGFANSAEFRAGVMKGLQAVRERQAVAYLSDTRKVKVIVREDQKWANETAAPLLAAAGLKRMAVVVADAGLGKVTVEETLRMINVQGLRIRTFNSKPEAMKWARDG